MPKRTARLLLVGIDQQMLWHIIESEIFPLKLDIQSLL